jgi:chemotaxis protein methyltransferase CheR
MSATKPADGGFEFPFSDKEFENLAAVVYERSGIVLGAHKKNMVYSRLARRLRSLGLASFKEYADLLNGVDGDDEVGSLINAITTNLTRFFRENHHFEHLKETVLADVTSNARLGAEKRLRIWSAGSSSGEEPYSIAMTVCEAMPEIAQWNAKILATDLDTNMVQRGSDGVYPAKGLEGISTDIQQKYFSLLRGGTQDSLQAEGRIRKLLTFKPLNLMGAWPLKGPFDAIFCRNVMIYFDQPTKTTLINRFAELLKPGGWLYVGHSESLMQGTTPFDLTGRTIYKKKD